MIVIDNTILSDELRTVCFACDLKQCKGACCVEGDAGAPLEEEEISLLEDHFDAIRPYMTPAGIREIETNGLFDYDIEGNFVTPLIHGKECAFVWFDNGIARCAIEQAWEEHAIPFRKPVSCHLYPIRIASSSLGDRVNYHQWPICRSALEKGKKEQIPLYRFLADALVRHYGKPWYDQLTQLLSGR